MDIYVTTNINGDIMGCSDSLQRAIEVFDQKYVGDIEHPERYISVYTLNEFYYA